MATHLKAETTTPGKGGFLSLSPIFVFALLFLGISIAAGDFYKVSLTIIFTISSIYSLFILRGMPINERICIFSRGAGQENLMLMIWIFILAGAFAQTAKDIGAIDSAVKLTLYILPSNLILAGLFIASCLVSMSIGTSVGTVVTLVPIAAGIAGSTGESPELVVASVIGGAFFGDNLSFISDTTIASTRTQEVSLSDKFKANFLIVLPAAIITVILYAFMGNGGSFHQSVSMEDVLKTLPYFVVIVIAICGVNVFLTLSIGILLVFISGISLHASSVEGMLISMGNGIASMGELIIISMLAGGMLEVIKTAGGIDYIIDHLKLHIHGKRGGELTIGFLVGIVNLCTANNTVAIISVGNLARAISKSHGINPCKSASILDTFSCIVQGLIPYGAQILMAAGLAGLNPVSIVPYIYYPMLLFVIAVLGIIVRYPKKYS